MFHLMGEGQSCRSASIRVWANDFGVGTVTKTRNALGDNIYQAVRRPESAGNPRVRFRLWGRETESATATPCFDNLD
jgi:hypothetical protein